MNKNFQLGVILLAIGAALQFLPRSNSAVVDAVVATILGGCSLLGLIYLVMGLVAATRSAFAKRKAQRP